MWCNVFLLAIENYFIQFLIQVLRSCYICILSNCDKFCNHFRFTKFDTFRHHSNFCSHFVNGAWPQCLLSQKIPNTRGLAPMFEQICLTAFTRRRVSMPSRAYTSFLRHCCQVEISNRRNARVNALSGLYLISTRTSTTISRWHIIVSMPSRAYTSFLRYPFKNLGFMRFPEPVFAGIYQNILTTAVFRAC